MKNKFLLRTFLFILCVFAKMSMPLEAKEIVEIQTLKGVKEIPLIFADTEQKRRDGLMYRKDLGEYAGMFFVFDKEEKIMMWMKNTFLSLDMVFFDKKGNVVNIVKKTEPLSLEIISSRFPAKYVLELLEGKVDEFEIDMESKIISIKNKNKLLQFK